MVNEWTYIYRARFRVQEICQNLANMAPQLNREEKKSGIKSKASRTRKSKQKLKGKTQEVRLGF